MSAYQTDAAMPRKNFGPRQHAGVDARLSAAMMSARHPLPWHPSLFGTQRLPPNHGPLRLALVQSMPAPLPSASLSTLVNQFSFASAELNGLSIWQPMNDMPGACSTTRQR